MKKILTASLVAMMAVTAANADIASTKYVTDQTGASETGTFTFTNAAKNATTLQGAVNAIADSLATNMGAGGSVETQIDNAIGDLGDSTDVADAIGKAIATAGTNADEKIKALDVTEKTAADGSYFGAYKQEDGKISMTEKAFETSIVQDEITKEYSDNAPSAAAVADFVTASVGATSNTLSGIIEAAQGTATNALDKANANAGDIEQLTGTVNTNKQAADATQTELTNYKAANDAALAGVRATADAAAVKTVVDASILDLQGKIDAVEAGTSLADNAVKTKNIDALAVTTEKINDKAVTTDKINDGAVTETQLNATVNASLDKADSAVQKTDVTTGTTNGTIKVQGQEVSVAGLGSAAYTEASAYDSAGSAAKALVDAKAEVKNLQDTLTALATFPTACAEGTDDCALVIRGGTMQWEKVSY